MKQILDFVVSPVGSSLGSSFSGLPNNPVRRSHSAQYRDLCQPARYLQIFRRELPAMALVQTIVPYLRPDGGVLRPEEAWHAPIPGTCYAETPRPFLCWRSLAQYVKTLGGTPLSHHRPQIELFAIIIKCWLPKSSAWWSKLILAVLSRIAGDQKEPVVPIM